MGYGPKIVFIRHDIYASKASNHLSKFWNSRKFSFNAKKEFDYDKLLLDSQFNRCLLAATFETVRHCYKPIRFRMEDIIRALDTRMFELGMALELCLNSDVIVSELDNDIL